VGNPGLLEVVGIPVGVESLVAEQSPEGVGIPVELRREHPGQGSREAHLQGIRHLAGIARTRQVVAVRLHQQLGL